MSERPFPDPGEIRHIHLIAVAGVGMASLAAMLRELGYRVTGSDRNVYPPMSTMLARLGIPVAEGFGPTNLDPAPDLVIVGNAVSRTNPEVVALLERDIPYASMPEAIGRLFLRGKRSLVVAGTHGKTTSTALLGWTLLCAGRDPGILVGGEVPDLGGSIRLGEGPEFVIEGDEYDSAFFDKDPKFLHYTPEALLLTAIEFDHADIYRDLDHVIDAFVRLLTLVSPNGPVIACADFPHVGTALRKSGRRAERFGFDPSADWRAENLREEGGRTCFEIRYRDAVEERIALRILGRLNVQNALGVFALARSLGLAAADCRNGLESFRGVRRRQEILLDDEVTIIDDFAHHPTSVRAVLTAVRERYPNRRLRAVLEPRSNTSRRRVFQDEFALALALADEAIIAPVFVKDTDSLAPEERLSVEALVGRIRSEGVEAATFSDTRAILEHLVAEARPGDVFVLMSNGGFDGLPPKLAARLGAVEATA